MLKPAGPLPERTSGAADSHNGDGLYFVLLFDPGPYPLANSMQLPRLQVIYGLRYGGFNPGTVLMDQASGETHIVRRQGDQLVLDPPVPMVLRVRDK